MPASAGIICPGTAAASYFFLACPGAVPVAAGVVWRLIWPGGTCQVAWHPDRVRAAVIAAQRIALRRVRGLFNGFPSRNCTNMSLFKRESYCEPVNCLA